MFKMDTCPVQFYVVVLLFLISATHAAKDKIKNLVKESYIPISSLIFLPLKTNKHFKAVSERTHFHKFLIKPVIPTRTSESWTLINCILLPLLYPNFVVLTTPMEHSKSANKHGAVIRSIEK